MCGVVEAAAIIKAEPGGGGSGGGLRACHRLRGRPFQDRRAWRLCGNRLYPPMGLRVWPHSNGIER